MFTVGLEYLNICSVFCMYMNLGIYELLLAHIYNIHMYTEVYKHIDVYKYKYT